MSEATKARAAWLAALKPGDEVAAPAMGGFRPGFGRWRVVRVTPRDIVVADGYGYERRLDRATGDERGRGLHRITIEPATDEIRAGWRREELLSRLQVDRWADLPTETLEAVAALVAAAKTK